MALGHAVCARVDELHGASAQADCPGADKCPAWRWLRQCDECPRGPHPPRRIDHGRERRTVALVEQAAAEVRSGLVAVRELDPVACGLVLLWQARERAHERRALRAVADVGAFVRGFAGEGERAAVPPRRPSAEFLAMVARGQKQAGRLKRTGEVVAVETGRGTIELERADVMPLPAQY